MKNFTVVFRFLFIAGYFSCFTSYAQNYNQPVQIKQITNFNFNARNPNYFKYLYNNNYQDGEIIFEAQHDSVSNIYLMKYNSQTDSFYNAYPLTNNNFKNMNPVGIGLNNSSLGEKIVLFQTNQNRNTDIAYSIYANNSWTTPSLLLSSSSNEYEPVLLLNNGLGGVPEFSFLYKKDKSVYFYANDGSTITNEVVFQGHDSIEYFSSAGKIIEFYPNYFIYVSAIKAINGDIKGIFCKNKNVTSSNWGSEQTVFDSGMTKNLKFNEFPLMADYNAGLSFEVQRNYRSDTYVMKSIDDFGKNYKAVRLPIDTSYNNFCFHTLGMNMIVDNNDIMLYGPYTFLLTKNGNTFLNSHKYVVPGYEAFTNDTLIQLKYDSPKINIVCPGPTYINAHMLSYILFEDSSNGKINLLGIKRLDPIGGINDAFPVNNFTLLQNYPNPFNPTTRIQYSVAGYQFVNLSVYDVLGRNIATLVNEQKQPGNYFIDFNANNLASGIYFYSLRVNNSTKTRKMIIIK